MTTKQKHTKSSAGLVACMLLLLSSTDTTKRRSLSSSLPSSLYVSARDSSNGIPRSTSRRFAASNDDDSSSSSSSLFGQGDIPPWNYSPQIHDDGFLKSTYYRIPGDWEEDANIGGKHGYKSKRYKRLQHLPVRVRQVPGDGNCLFHSISTCLSWLQNKTHVSMTGTNEQKQVLRDSSSYLRQCAVDCLEKNPRRVLFLQGDEYMRAEDLVDSAAAQYDLSGERYCELMRLESYWGGGPEIVALSNVLRRPIHVYELCPSSSSTSSSPHQQLSAQMSDLVENDSASGGAATKALKSNKNKRKQQQDTFCLRRMACFGSPKFDRREPIHILSADSRFPDVTPGNQLASGNHFLAMFPLSNDDVKKMRSSRIATRGGSSSLAATKCRRRLRKVEVAPEAIDDEDLDASEDSEFYNDFSLEISSDQEVDIEDEDDGIEADEILTALDSERQIARNENATAQTSTTSETKEANFFSILWNNLCKVRRKFV